MTAPSSYTSRFRVHLTNVAGTGAVQLLGSLLPALERAAHHHLERIYLPDRGELSGYERLTPGTTIKCSRILPNAVSRVVECLWPGRRFNDPIPLLVMGDLPLRCSAPQAVFVQSVHLTLGAEAGSRLNALKYWVARAVFRANLRYPNAFIVQTEPMKRALTRTFPGIDSKVHVIHQPVPAWLIAAQLKRKGRRGNRDEALNLFFPAAPYPHKNHRVLARVAVSPRAWPVRRLTLTIPSHSHPAPHVPWIHCVGALQPPAVLEEYRAADALLFLSLAESYGLPLVEAMWIGLPIVCPDLPYARALCADEAIYFQPDDIDSLYRALSVLHDRLQKGWWPNWSRQLAPIPKSWDAVAQAMLALLPDARQGS